MKASTIFATCLAILLSLVGCDAPPENKTTLGSHTLTIVDTSGKPLGGDSGTKLDESAGTKSHFFKSANGRYMITLENNVMLVNGVSYTLKNAGSSIHIEDKKVKIDGVETSPDSET